MRLTELKSVPAEDVLAYVNSIHDDFHIPDTILVHPKWRKTRVPLNKLHVPDPESGEDLDDPYNRVQMIDMDHVADIDPNEDREEEAIFHRLLKREEDGPDEETDCDEEPCERDEPHDGIALQVEVAVGLAVGCLPSVANAARSEWPEVEGAAVLISLAEIEARSAVVVVRDERERVPQHHGEVEERTIRAGRQNILVVL